MSNHTNSDVIRMSDIKEQKVQWLWYPYIPAGKITMLQGDPGDGKTMLILTLSALLSNGLPLPEQETGTEPNKAVNFIAFYHSFHRNKNHSVVIAVESNLKEFLPPHYWHYEKCCGGRKYTIFKM